MLMSDLENVGKFVDLTKTGTHKIHLRKAMKLNLLLSLYIREAPVRRVWWWV